MKSLISPDGHILIWSVLLAVSLLGMYGERVGWFSKISGALVTILAAAILTTVGILPPAADPELSVEIYGWVFTYFIPFAIPLLLFNVQLKRILNDTGRLLLPFLIGAAGVAIGAIVAGSFLEFGEETHKVMGAFIGTYTGGSVNFMAVSTALDFLESDYFVSTITVDNVFTNVYIVLIFLLPGIKWVADYFAPYVADESKELEESKASFEFGVLMEHITLCLFISAGIFVCAEFLAPLLASLLGTEIDLEVLIITTAIIALVNIFPKFFLKYQEVAFNIGMFLMYVFLAVIGASSNLNQLWNSIPGIILFATIILVVHLIVVLVAGKLLKVSLKEIMIASAANIAGPSVAAPMAVSFGMPKAITPGILIGLLGYVIGTFLGIGVGAAMG
ncbi:MAG: DUF819 family protein [Bacteroidia bacterium]|nr:DUF819 family protein [Bacteroidia bacterium]